MVKALWPRKSNPIIASTLVPKACSAKDRSRTTTGNASVRSRPSCTLGAIPCSVSSFCVKTESFPTVLARRSLRAIRRSKTLGTAPVSVATVLIVVLAVSGWLAWHSRYKRQLRLIVRQLTAHPADNPLLRQVISPDGKYLAHCDDAGISLQHIDTGEARLLPRTKSFCVADWFPDGATLAALKDNDLWVVSSVTGAMRKIAHNIWAAWVSPDGARIAFFKIEGGWDTGGALDLGDGRRWRESAHRCQGGGWNTLLDFQLGTQWAEIHRPKGRGE